MHYRQTLLAACVAILTIGGALMAPCAAQDDVEAAFYVAPGGSDDADGTRGRPFATLERARDAVRALKQAQGLPAGGATIWLRGGRYELAQPLELSAEDSGADGAPIVYRTMPRSQAIISGGVRVPPRAFEPVEDTAVLGRLPREAWDHVLQADLKSLGVEEYGSPAGGGLEVFFGDERMTLARWPNEGFTRITDILNIQPRDVRGTKGDAVGKFVWDNDRLERWLGEDDLWLHGYWFWDWSDERQAVARIDIEDRTISLEEPYHRYGYRKGQWFYAYNALAEIDQPGEWYLDREAGVLYFWPPDDIDDRPVTVSVASELVRASDVSYVRFEGLTFEAARGTGVVISGGEGCEITGCTFRAIGAFAARLAGTGHRVAHCDAYNLGHGGFAISGGDRATLTPAGLEVENCHIHDFGQWRRMYVPGVSISGVGNRIRHNLIHTAPHQAISFSGNDHLMEFNEIHSVCYESNDAGAIYSGRNWTMRGTVIRNNYMHHVVGREGRGAVGVYLDDMYCGTEISGNIFYRVTRAAFIGGGRDNAIVGNVFVDCPRAIHIDARAMGWAAASVPTTMTDRLNEMPYQSELWRERYPELVNILQDEPAAPKGNLVARNIIAGPFDWRDIDGRAEPYQTIRDNLVLESSAFFDPEGPSLDFQQISPHEEIGFEAIPTERIGLYRHEARPTWPVRDEVMPRVIDDWFARQAPAARERAQRRRGPRPTFAITPTAAEITIDGRISGAEWGGARPRDAMLIAQGVHGEKTAPQSLAWLRWDPRNETLLVAIRNDVSDEKPLRMGNNWGSDDAVEIAVRRTADSREAPILILRGYPSGHFESSPEAGADPEDVERAASGVEYAAHVEGPRRWSAEWRIPLASLGLPAQAGTRFALNISVRKSAQPLWQMWRGTGAHTWDVDQGGIATLAE